MDIIIDRVILSSEFAEHDDEMLSAVTDVIVVLSNGYKYAASFIPYSEVEHIREHSMQSGEFLNGLYYWGHNMVLVESCEQKTVERVVEHMIEEGDFSEAFRKL